MKDIAGYFKTKKLRRGVFSTFTIIILIAVMVAVNLIADKMNLKIDMTREKLYSISDETKQALGALSEDVTIYTLFQTGTESLESNIIVWELLSQYQANSEKIKLENKDPSVYKPFVDEFSKNGQPIENGSIILQSEKRSKVIQASKLSSAVQDQQTGAQSVEFWLEYEVTNGLTYVTQEKPQTVYMLTGHNEIGISPNFQIYMDDAGFDVKTVDLSGQAKVPEDCGVLIFTTPIPDYTNAAAESMADLSREDTDKVLAYLQGGGKAMFLIDSLPVELPNLNSIMRAYGIQYNDFYIFEGDANRHYPGDNLLIVPTPAAHPISYNLVTMLYGTNSISILGDHKDSLIIEPLLQTSALAYGKNDPDAESVNKEEGDFDGPFLVGIAVTDSKDAGTAKIVAVGSSFITNEDLDSFVGGNNGAFFIRSLSWLTDKTNIYIPAKSLDTSYNLNLTQQQALYIKLFAAIILPLAVFGIGFFVWSRRRNK